MAISRLYNLARMSTSTTGTGTITLGSASTGFLSFAGAGVSNGETVTYAIKDGANSEIGRGVYTSSGTTLTRTVLKSTNSNSAISLSGTAEVFITAASDDFLLADTVAFGTDNLLIRTDGTGKNMQSTGIIVDDNNFMSPATTDAGALGTTSLHWSDVFLASGAVINFNSGDVTITHSANLLAFAGASSGYTFDVPIGVASGGTGAATLTNRGVLIGQSTSPVAATAAGTAGQYLQSGGSSADPAFTDPPVLGECQFVNTSSSICTLNRFGGKLLFIAGKNETIPSTAPTLGLGGLGASTTYYVYAYMSGGTMTLEASTTATAVDATYGHLIKSGDGTRTYVGVVRTTSGTVFSDIAAARFVASYFNPRQISCRKAMPSNRTTTSTGFVEINSADRAEFVVASTKAGYINKAALGSHATAGVLGYAAVGLDGAATLYALLYAAAPAVNYDFNMSSAQGGVDLTVGYHYITLAGATGSGTLTYANTYTAVEILIWI